MEQEMQSSMIFPNIYVVFYKNILFLNKIFQKVLKFFLNMNTVFHSVCTNL